VMPAGLWGLDVVLGDRVRPPHARFTCRCGYVASERSSPDAVRLFVVQVPEAHRVVCRLRQGEAGGSLG
jgi:hypothetical protein